MTRGIGKEGFGDHLVASAVATLFLDQFHATVRITGKKRLDEGAHQVVGRQCGTFGRSIPVISRKAAYGLQR